MWKPTPVDILRLEMRVDAGEACRVEAEFVRLG
jgi:hypothetical protein